MSIIRVGEFQFKKFIDKEKIAELILKMAKEVDAFYNEKDELEFIVILDGSYHFASDFTRVFPRDAKVHFIKAKSYVGLKSSGDVKIQGLEEIEILDFIVSTGRRKNSDIGNVIKHYALFPTFLDEETMFGFYDKFYNKLGIKLIPYYS